MADEIEFSPYKNEKAMSIIQQSDGNWIGYVQKNGKVVSVRDVGPQTVVQLLITHDGT